MHRSWPIFVAIKTLYIKKTTELHKFSNICDTRKNGYTVCYTVVTNAFVTVWYNKMMYL